MRVRVSDQTCLQLGLGVVVDCQKQVRVRVRVSSGIAKAKGYLGLERLLDAREG
jgi:hypothetical protein